MNLYSRYDQSVKFLAQLDGDWARLIAEIGPCRHDPKGAREPYEALVRAVAYQQLAAKAGDAILARLKASIADGRFPNPEQLIAADFDAMRACGFSARKIETIKDIARGARAGLVPSRKTAAKMSDEILVEQLAAIKGIGRWTVEMLLMYSLERMDVCPADDFGAREGYRILKSLAEQPKPKELRAISEAWAPHRTVATWYLWRMPRPRVDQVGTTSKGPSNA